MRPCFSARAMNDSHHRAGRAARARSGQHRGRADVLSVTSYAAACPRAGAARVARCGNSLLTASSPQVGDCSLSSRVERDPAPCAATPGAGRRSGSRSRRGRAGWIRPPREVAGASASPRSRRVDPLQGASGCDSVLSSRIACSSAKTCVQPRLGVEQARSIATISSSSKAFRWEMTTVVAVQPLDIDVASRRSRWRRPGCAGGVSSRTHHYRIKPGQAFRHLSGDVPGAISRCRRAGVAR